MFEEFGDGVLNGRSPAVGLGFDLGWQQGEVTIAAVDDLGALEGGFGDRTEDIKSIFADANDGEPGGLHGGDLF